MGLITGLLGGTLKAGMAAGKFTYRGGPIRRAAIGAIVGGGVGAARSDSNAKQNYFMDVMHGAATGALIGGGSAMVAPIGRRIGRKLPGAIAKDMPLAAAGISKVKMAANQAGLNDLAKQVGLDDVSKLKRGDLSEEMQQAYDKYTTGYEAAKESFNTQYEAAGKLWGSRKEKLMKAGSKMKEMGTFATSVLPGGAGFSARMIEGERRSIVALKSRIGKAGSKEEANVLRRELQQKSKDLRQYIANTKGKLDDSAFFREQSKVYNKYDGSIANALDQNIPGFITSAGKFAYKNPGIMALGAGTAAIGTMLYEPAKGAIDSARKDNSSMTLNQNRQNQKMANNMGMYAPSPGTGIGVSYMNSNFANSTYGLVQGLHRGRH